MKNSLNKTFVVFATLCLAPVLAQAHILQGDPAGFHHGFLHPMFGFDHILAMVAVGLWAAQLGGRALWAVPASFVSVMALGGLWGASGLPMPLAETGILASIFFLGIFLLAALRLPLYACTTIVGLFALCHGFAHGAEMPATISGLEYGLGFVLATALLHGSGMALGWLARQPVWVRIPLLRVSGACILVLGAVLALT